MTKGCRFPDLLQDRVDALGLESKEKVTSDLMLPTEPEPCQLYAWGWEVLCLSSYREEGLKSAFIPRSVPIE